MKLLQYILFTLFFVGCSLNGIAQNDLSNLIEQLNQSTDESQKVSLLKQVALTYSKSNAYKKSNEYLIQLLSLQEKSNDTTGQAETLNMLGENALKLAEYDDALTYFQSILSLTKEEESVVAQEKIIELFTIQDNYTDALDYAERLATFYKQQNDIPKQAKVFNTLGFLSKKLGMNSEAKTYFDSALLLNKQLYQKEKSKPLSEQQAAILINLGVAQTFLENYNSAIGHYAEAIKIHESRGDTASLAHVSNYIAATNLTSGNIEQALVKVNQAITYAELSNNSQALSDSYKILSEVYNADGNFLASQNAFKRHLALQEEIEQQEEAERQALIERQIAAERNESELKQAIAKQREQELALNQARLEAEKKEQELALQQRQFELLNRDKELQESRLANQKLEQEQVQQALALANQNLERERQEKELAQVQQQREIEQKEQELKEAEQQKQLQLSEAQRKLQEQEIAEREKTEKYYFYGLIAGFIFVVFILFSIIQRNKAYKKLSEQKKEIDHKNQQLVASEEEIRQNMEELKTTQEAVEVQNVELASKNRTVTESIQAALAIQTAILPTAIQRDAIFPKNFMIFRPKDIVSGDFFWIYEDKEEKIKIASVIDCTGHGVPGAFMSLVGSDILTEIVEIKGERNPAKILSALNYGVRTRLSQDEGLSDEGMDLVVCVFEPLADKKVKLTFAGAKGKMYYVENETLHELKGDRKAIGGKHNNDHIEFTNQEVVLNPDTMLYLFSDGFIDQADLRRKRFSSVKFKKLLLEIYQKSLLAQRQLLEEALDNHQGKEAQRDDITVMGLRI